MQHKENFDTEHLCVSLAEEFNCCPVTIGLGVYNYNISHADVQWHYVIGKVGGQDGFSVSDVVRLILSYYEMGSS